MEEHEQEHGLLGWLDSWRLAAACAVALAILLGIWSIKLTADTRHLAETNSTLLEANREITHDLRQVQKDQRARDRVANQNQVDQCLSQNAQMPGIRGLLLALRDVVRDPVQRQHIDNYLALLVAQTPDKDDCKALAKKLGVEVP